MVTLKNYGIFFVYIILNLFLNMRNTVIFLIAIIFTVAGCKTPVNIAAYRQNAETATETGDFVLATEQWKQYFSQLPADEQPGGEVYASAAQTAYKAANPEQALEWYELARQREYDEPSMHLTIAEIYRNMGDVAMELSALEAFKEKSSKEDPEVNTRLFDIYYSANQQEKALEAWHDIPETEKRKAERLEIYYTLNKKLGNEATADSASLALLEVDPDNIDALTRHAEKNYEKGEVRYQREMKSYQAKPTTGNYQTLLRGLKAASVDFRKSLQYFEKLWEVNPDDRGQYAAYMSNIHVRFNDKEKADYYKKFIK